MTTGLFPSMADFNPRSREGSDDSWCFVQVHSVYFNPRSREGSDFPIRVHTEQASVFQSTLP